MEKRFKVGDHVRTVGGKAVCLIGTTATGAIFGTIETPGRAPWEPMTWTAAGISFSCDANLNLCFEDDSVSLARESARSERVARAMAGASEGGLTEWQLWLDSAKTFIAAFDACKEPGNG